VKSKETEKRRRKKRKKEKKKRKDGKYEISIHLASTVKPLLK
jgi:hypothetical protein